MTLVLLIDPEIFAISASLVLSIVSDDEWTDELDLSANSGR
jgi:hypothetical protein